VGLRHCNRDAGCNGHKRAAVAICGERTVARLEDMSEPTKTQCDIGGKYPCEVSTVLKWQSWISGCILPKKIAVCSEVSAAELRRDVHRTARTDNNISETASGTNAIHGVGIVDVSAWNAITQCS